MTTALTTRSSTPPPVSTPLQWWHTTSRRSSSPCPVMLSGCGSPLPPPLAILWWWAWSMPSRSELDELWTGTERPDGLQVSPKSYNRVVFHVAYVGVLFPSVFYIKQSIFDASVLLFASYKLMSDGECGVAENGCLVSINILYESLPLVSMYAV
ncbi:hypothetical protein AOLI_G00036230 [Acnodon oligacanthus]